MRRATLIVILVCAGACDGPDADVDGGIAPGDAAGSDAAAPGGDAGPPLDGGTAAGVDAGAPGPDAGPTGPERCDTADDEDGDGESGCDDPDCWSEAACEAEARTHGGVPTSWTACGDPIELNAEETASACLVEPTLGSLPHERACELRDATARAQVYCEPEGEGRALRVEATIDATPIVEMLGPRSQRRTHIGDGWGFSHVELFTSSGGSAGESPPARYARGAASLHALFWLAALETNDLAGFHWPVSTSTTRFDFPDEGPPTTYDEGTEIRYVGGAQITIP